MQRLQQNHCHSRSTLDGCLLSTGCRLVLWDVNQEGLDAVAKEIKTAGGEVHSYKCNLRDKTEIHETAARVKEDVGEVSLLVNNAGIVSGKKFMDCTDEEISATFDVNSLAHFWVSLFRTVNSLLYCMFFGSHLPCIQMYFPCWGGGGRVGYGNV